MKKLFILLALLFSQNFLNASWINKGDYFEIRFDYIGLKNIVVPSDSDYIILLDKADFVYKLDFDGHLLDSIEMKKNGYTFKGISQDGLTANYFRTDTSYDFQGKKITSFWRCESLFGNDSLFEIEINSDYYPEYTPAKSSGYSVSYSSKLNIGLIINNTYYSDGGITYESYYNGVISIHDFSLNKRIGKLSGSCNSFFMSSDFSFALFSTYNSHDSYNRQSNFYWKIESYYFSYFNNFLSGQEKWISYSHYESNYPEQNVNAFIPTQFRASSDHNYIIATYNKKLYKYSRYSDNFIISDSCDLSFKPVVFDISKNNKYIIMATSNNKIDILSSDNFQIVKSYNLQDSLNSEIICILTNRNGFLTGNSAGSLKYFTADTILSSLPILSEYYNGFSISPNPATDFIEFSINKGLQPLVQNMQVMIYNVFGQEINPTPALPKGREFGSQDLGGVLRIDISSLPPGVYFVRVGEKVGKFVKF